MGFLSGTLIVWLNQEMTGFTVEWKDREVMQEDRCEESHCMSAHGGSLVWSSGWLWPSCIHFRFDLKTLRCFQKQSQGMDFWNFFNNLIMCMWKVLLTGLVLTEEQMETVFVFRVRWDVSTAAHRSALQSAWAWRQTDIMFLDWHNIEDIIKVLDEWSYWNRRTSNSRLT